MIKIAITQAAFDAIANPERKKAPPTCEWAG
jgi:hypothetical protein